MTDSVALLMKGLALIGASGAAYWVSQDAGRLHRRGVKVSRRLWVVLVFLGWIPALPAYLALRKWYWLKQAGPEPEPESQPHEAPAPASAEELADPCSEQTIRTLVREHAGRSPREAWRELHEHYYRHACADEMELDRFEELVAESLRTHSAPTE